MDIAAVQILVADADASVRDIILYSTNEQGWIMDEAKNGVEAIKRLRRNRYNLLVIDTELPIIDGFMVYSQFGSSIPVIFLGKKTSEQDRIAPFEAGGNDYLIKPFYPRELIARIKSLLRLAGHASPDDALLRRGDIKINLNSQDVFVKDKLIRLTPREYSLLVFLCQNINQAFSRETLLNMVWGHQFDGMDRTVDTHIKSLRDKIKPCDKYIVTIWSYGYKMVV